ncbi:MAG: hypothetical protein OXI96_10575 [Acidimicrobiaceae bacterium]|nr:hypothetical protein [Acidimicrobiaceae bacterium]
MIHETNDPADPQIITIRPYASAEEQAAIRAAYKALWPAPDNHVITPEPLPRWRYSGRPWRKKIKYGNWR